MTPYTRVLIALLAGLLLISVPFSAAAAERVLSATFEDDAPDQFPSGWQDFPAPVDPPSARVANLGAAGTTKSMRIRDVNDGKTSAVCGQFPPQDRIRLEFRLAVPANSQRVFNFWTREPGGSDASQINLAIHGTTLQQYDGRIRSWVAVTDQIKPSVDANRDGDLTDPEDRVFWHLVRVIADRSIGTLDIWVSKPNDPTLTDEPAATRHCYRTDLPFGSINFAYGRLAKGAYFHVDEIAVDGGEDIPEPHTPDSLPQVKRYQLWDGEPPVAEDSPYLDNVTFSRVHRAIPGEYQFLHGPAVVSYKGTLFTSWANSLTDENSASETLRGRRSSDDGLTWSDIEFIGPGFAGSERHSHGVFIEHEGRLWAFGSQFGKEPEDGANFPGLGMAAFVLNEETDKWESRGVVADDCWPMTEPTRMENGSWIIPGLDRHFRAAVAISNGNDMTAWQTVKIPLAAGQSCSETTAWVMDDEIIAIMRNESPHDPAFRCAAVSVSRDFGKTWSVAQESNFPMLSAKAAAGVLSTGQPYIVSNSGLRNNARWPLTIAVGEPGGKTLCRMWRIRDGKTLQPVLAGRAKDPGWQYPYAYEHGGKLYVIYSVGKEDAELAIIPLGALATD